MEISGDKPSDNIKTGFRAYDEPLLPESIRSGSGGHFGNVMINSEEKERLNEKSEKNETEGKVFMLNYFDTTSGEYKKILVKKFNVKN